MMLFPIALFVLGGIVAVSLWIIKRLFKKIDDKISQADKNLENGKVKIKQGKSGTD